MSARNSVAETPPTTEDDQECDQILHTALKKLKMDSECACTVTKKADSQAPLKHKHDPGLVSTTAGEQQGEDESEWSKPLENLCLCDTQASGETISKPLCTCHKHRWHKAKSTGARNNLNLAHAAGVRKPILREPRLRFPVGDKSKQVLRASRLRVASKAGVSKELSAALTNNMSASYTSTTASLSSSGTISASTHSQAQQTKQSVPSQAAFASASLGDLASFASLTLSPPFRTHHNPDREKRAEAAPQFDGYRDSLRPTPLSARRSELLESAAAMTGGTAAPESHASPPVAVPSPSKLDLTMERSCSQEARLDEMSVNELAAYFDDFIHIPKKMSSMAEMMYT
ncbi:hypothetical protein BaRGS_00007674 [Batillaria attramentaria]|uniref:Oxidative stress-responsive serine-rich protein 1 n=1 Tax=Batillaria attramentaria TaxID=370345 RepID=A0ABD0LQA7_9CAEN